MRTRIKNRQPSWSAGELGLVFVLHLIGWDGGTRFLGQLQSEVKQNQSNDPC